MSHSPRGPAAPVYIPEYIRLAQIVAPEGVLPVGRATFYSWIARGIAPKPLKLGRISLWRRADIIALIERGAP